jgi:hypothetical protein
LRQAARSKRQAARSHLQVWYWLPVWKTIHIVGIVLLMGVATAVDLRIFGVAKALPRGPLQRLMPWALAGFAVSLASGVVLVRANPPQYLGMPLNLVFYGKMLCLVLVCLNDLLYFATGLKKESDGIQAGESASASAKIVAGVSLALWCGVIYLGITIPFFGTVS